MGTLDRVYRLLKSYINDQYERLQEIERQYAETELDDPTTRIPPQASPTSATPLSRPPSVSDSPEILSAYRVLGVQNGSDIAVVRAAYTKLIRRADPGRFPEGSEESNQASEIRKRVDLAYETLQKALDPSSKRFRQLEIK